jgi:hypothetical protein
MDPDMVVGVKRYTLFLQCRFGFALDDLRVASPERSVPQARYPTTPQIEV